MQKIIPHLWYDTQAKEAAEFYTSIFPNSKITEVNTLNDTPSGKVETVGFELANQKFASISAGPYFKFTPAISFLVSCESTEEVDQIWGKISENGQIMMPLDSYPFSEKFGWTTDKYGLSWQIMYVKETPITQKITPALMFIGNNYGKGEEAINFYTKVFHNSKINNLTHFEADEDSGNKGKIKHASFTLENLEFALMENSFKHDFTFNEAISFIVNCEDQKEIDYYWDKLSAVPESEQCGWLKDQFGVSWQINPSIMDEMLNKGTQQQKNAVTQAFLKMKKFDIATLQKVFEENN